MICALTVRKLKPGTFEQFAEAFRPTEGGQPASMRRFTMLRNAADPDEVVTFGHFDGSRDELESEQRGGYDELLVRITPFVDSVIANGVYEVVAEENF